MPAEEVRALGRTLGGRARSAEEVHGRLEGDVDGPLRTPVEEFLACHALLATALAGELDRLGATVTGIADSWVQLDAALVPPTDGSGPR